MSVLVTGAAGFIGSHVVDALLASGEDVVGMDSFHPFYPRALKEENLRSARDHRAFRLVEGDIRCADHLRAVPDGVELVVHLAARAGVRPSIQDPEGYVSTNVQGTWILLEWMARRGVGRLAFASSSSVYGNHPCVPFREDVRVDRPVSPYAASKVAGELACHTSHHLDGLSVLALRFFTVHGPRQRPDLAIHRFVRLLDAGEPIPMFGDGGSERDYTYVGDIVEGVRNGVALLRRADPFFEVVNLGDHRTVALRRMIEILGEEMGVSPRIDRLPPQPGDVRRTFADIGKARRLLGYEPSVGFREGVRNFLDWFGSRRS